MRKLFMISGNSEVLVFPPNWLGDSIMALPAINRIAAGLPQGSKLTMLCRGRVADFWRLFPETCEVAVLPESFIETIKTVWRLKSRKFKAAFVFPRTWRAALVARFAGIPLVRGFLSSPASFCFHDVVPDLERDQEHLVLTYLRILKAESNSAEKDLCFIKNELRKLLVEKSQKFSTSPYICLIPGAARGAAKRWPSENYIHLGRDLLAKYQQKIFILGSASEATLCETIALAIGDQAKSLAGATKLADFAALLANAKLVVCNDSGGMHLAAALGTPLVAIFGETNPVVTGPYSSNAFVLQKSEKRQRKIAPESESAIAALRLVSPADVMQLIERENIL